jgi:hypothetical protein
MEKVIKTFSMNFKKKKMRILILSIVVFVGLKSYAQADTIFTKGNQQILCTKIKETADQYNFTYLTAENKKAKSSILKYLVDSIKYNVPVLDTSGTVKKSKKIKVVKPVENNETVVKEKPWKKTISFGINVGNILEFNNPGGTDKKNISLTTSLDFGLNYKKQGKKFEMTNELHYLFGLQKEGLSGGTNIQRLQDDLATLHDISLGFGKNNKWNFNVIIRTATSVFEIFDGDYFKNFTTLGRIKGFASPYDVTVSPGIKYQPNQNFRMSLSPYSFNMYGVKNNEISTKGIFITDLDAGGNFKKFLFKRQGAEINFWYDKRVKEWLDMQYRLSFSSDYFEKFGKNGLMDGLFITKIRIVKDIYFTHRASIKSNLAVNFLKPYYNQTVLLSYAKSF